MWTCEQKMQLAGACEKNQNFVKNFLRTFWGFKAPCKRTQHCWMLHVASVCTPCCMLLNVVAQGLKPVTLFSQQLPTVPWSPKRSAMLDPFAQLFQHYWGQAGSLRILYKDLWVVSGGLVVSFPRCTVGPNNVESCCILLRTTANTAQQCWELLHPSAHHCQHGTTMLRVVASFCAPLPTRHNNVGSCCVRFQFTCSLSGQPRSQSLSPTSLAP